VRDQIRLIDRETGILESDDPLDGYSIPKLLIQHFDRTHLTMCCKPMRSSSV